MAIRKEGNRWLVDMRIQEGTLRRRIRKKFPTKPEAIRFEAYVRNQSNQGKAWNPVSSDHRTLRELIDRWYQVHGQSLKDGERRRDCLYFLDELLGSPRGIDVTAGMYANMRSRRLQEIGPKGKKVSANTVNHDLAYLKAVYNKLIEIDEWQGANPLAKVAKLPFDQTEMRWLSSDEIDALLSELRKSNNESAYWVARICLGTGCRWGQGESLKRSQIRAGEIYYPGDKRGNPRTVPYQDPEFDAWLEKTKRQGALFTPCTGAFRKALERAGIDLPDGQLTHVCRHTFATNQMEKGCSLRTLQYLLGHKTLSETIKYAHFANDALASVPGRSPLAGK